MTFATTLGGVIERVKRDQTLASRGPVYSLASTHVAGSDTILINETPIAGGTGSVLSMGTSSYYVLATDPVAKSFTVIPAYHGTTDETHDPPMVVNVDDRYPGGALKDHAWKTVQSWRNKLWQVETLDLDVTSNNRTFDLPLVGDFKFLLDVRRRPLSSTWYGFHWSDLDRWPHVAARLLRDMPVADFASGYALQLLNPTPSTSLRVAFAIGFDLDPFDWSTDLVADVGLREDWIEILDLGVRARALAGHVSSRVDWRAGGHVREGEEVSALDVARAAETARAEYTMALNEAANALRGEWPYRSR